MTAADHGESLPPARPGAPGAATGHYINNRDAKQARRPGQPTGPPQPHREPQADVQTTSSFLPGPLSDPQLRISLPLAPPPPSPLPPPTSRPFSPHHRQPGAPLSAPEAGGRPSLKGVEGFQSPGPRPLLQADSPKGPGSVPKPGSPRRSLREQKTRHSRPHPGLGHHVGVRREARQPQQPLQTELGLQVSQDRARPRRETAAHPGFAELGGEGSSSDLPRSDGAPSLDGVQVCFGGGA